MLGNQKGFQTKISILDLLEWNLSRYLIVLSVFISKIRASRGGGGGGGKGVLVFWSAMVFILEWEGK